MDTTIASKNPSIVPSTMATTVRATAAGPGELPESIDSKLRKRNSTTEHDDQHGHLNSSFEGGKAPVPNFCVEGSNTGDSSALVTVGVGTLSTSSTLTSSLVKSDNECASLVDSSLGTETETEEPGVTTASTNGDLLSSLQSSEPDEMPLSLVSWYSEPGDCVSACSNSACACGPQSFSEANGDVSKSELSDGIIKSDHSQATEATPTAPNPKVDFLSEEKENKTPGSASVIPASTSTHPTSHIPSRTAAKKKEQCSDSQAASASKKNQREKSASSASANKLVTNETKSRRRVDKMHVQAFEQKSETNHNSITSVPGHSLVEHSKDGGRPHRERERVECPRCSRRSKSGSTPPAPSKSASRRHGHHNSNNHTPNGDSTGRTHQTPNTSASTTCRDRELKKPIKSILKSESRDRSGSGSGSEKQSSMDSLGSNSGAVGVVMTRSDTRPRTKFYINNSNDSISYPEDRMVSKLKQIEKYATVRVKKGKGRQEVNSSPDEGNATRERTNSETETSMTDFIPDLMTKSMSFLEKSSNPFSHQSHQSRGILPNSSGPSSLKRQGSLKIRKPSPGWEPGATRTSALRLLKMQESKAKTGSFTGGSGIGNGSAHSGSGESILGQHHGTPPTMRHHHHHHHASRSATASTTSTAPAVKERGTSSNSAKVFTKLSSAFGQTASSSMKRLRQEKSVQTDNVTVVDSITSPVPTAVANSKTSSASNSPEPLLYNFDTATAVAAATANTLDQQTEQIKQLESLVKRYKTSALRFQKEFERTDKKNYELKKQLQENQMESNEMLEFLQAEKSTLAESLVEVETECKKLTRELESVVKESQSRCSSLVRLSEQHKQEALKAQTLLTRLETHTNARITQQATQLTQGREAIRGIKSQILCLIDTLMRTYKVSQDRLAMDGFAESTAGASKDETELRCTLLLPLIRSLSRAFDTFKTQLKNNEIQAQAQSQAQIINNHHTVPTSNGTVAILNSNSTLVQGQANSVPDTSSTGPISDPNTSLQKLNQAIIEREKAEAIGLDKGTTTAADDLSLHDELDQLQVALRKLCTVIRIIVIHCDQKVSNVASDILQVLKSETDRLEMNINTGLHNGSKIATTAT